jgi:hypothetical protein
MLAGEVFGIGATRITERAFAIRHLLDETPVRFESSQCVDYIGLLLLLPFLIASGLLSYRNYYEELRRGYYYIDVIILVLAYMYLGRIKNPEQLKKISPGEFGKLLGTDRIPETKCLRAKLKQICNQGKSNDWNMELTTAWSAEENAEFYYVDGHVQVYSGYSATLGKKHISRQKLCLPGNQEFWVNNNNSLPYFYVTGEVNEKLIEMLKVHIIPKLLKEIKPRYTTAELLADPDLPVFTVVFDREGFMPLFFKMLWEMYRVAVLTYRKNVKDIWKESDFTEYTIETDTSGDKTKMKLAEKEVVLNNVCLREIRKLSDDGHQTSIITSNKKLSKEVLAVNMFARWTQENFFKYMRKEYDFDRMMQYVVEQADGEFMVSNPVYNNLTYYIKKIREKISRKRAKLFELVHENVINDLDKTSGNIKKQSKETEALDALEKEEAELIYQRNLLPSRIKIKDMPEKTRYNRLHIESKRFQNIIKMVCYRAETSCANTIAGFYQNHKNDKRELVKSIITSKGDLICDEDNGTLSINIYSLSSPRMNDALSKLCDILNDAEYTYPGTNLRLIYKIAK